MFSNQYIEQIDRIMNQMEFQINTFLAVIGFVLALAAIFQWRLNKGDINKLKEEIKNDFNKKISKTDKELNAKINEIDKELSSQINKADTNLNEKTNELEKELSSQINNANTDFNKKTNEVEKELNSQINIVDTNLNKKILKIIEENEAKLSSGINMNGGYFWIDKDNLIVFSNYKNEIKKGLKVLQETVQLPHALFDPEKSQTSFFVEITDENGDILKVIQKKITYSSVLIEFEPLDTSSEIKIDILVFDSLEQ